MPGDVNMDQFLNTRKWKCVRISLTASEAEENQLSIDDI
jgi:hypothetical protein